MSPRSSRQRAVAEFPYNGTLFVNSIKEGNVSNESIRSLSIQRIEFRSVSIIMSTWKKIEGRFLLEFWNGNNLQYSTRIQVPDEWDLNLYLTIVCDSILEKHMMLSLFVSNKSKLASLNSKMLLKNANEARKVARVSMAKSMVIGG